MTPFAFDAALARTKQVLKDEGFGVLSVDFRPYTILGACNPQLAQRALSAEDDVGLLLPCNVVVAADEGGTRVSAIDAAAMMGMVGNPALTAIAAEVNERLERVLIGTRSKRRDLLALTGAAGAITALPIRALASTAAATLSGRADIAVRIVPATIEIAPGHTVRTTTYGGVVPGATLRMREGVPVTVDVYNETNAIDVIHWHGQIIRPSVDGVIELGTPPVPARGHPGITPIWDRTSTSIAAASTASLVS
jgi:uncharacterized protein (DUF302 family)